MNQAEATVIAIIYRGSDTQVRVRLGNGELISVDLPNRSFEAPDAVTPGATIELAWAPASTSILAS